MASACHSHADQHAVFADRARLGVALRPAEAFRPNAIAVLESIARPRRTVGRRDVGIVAQPKFDRIDAEPGGQFVHRTFLHQHAGRLAGRAREGRRHDIRALQAAACLQRRQVVHEREGIPSWLGPILPGGRRRERRKLHAHELAVTPGAKPHIDALLLAKTDRRIHLRAGQNEADRPSDLACGKRGKPGVRPETRFAAKAATDIAHHHMDILARQVEYLSEAVAVVENVLAGLVERQPVGVFPHYQRSGRLHRIVMVVGKVPPGFEYNFRRVNRGSAVATLDRSGQQSGDVLEPNLLRLVEWLA